MARCGTYDNVPYWRGVAILWRAHAVPATLPALQNRSQTYSRKRIAGFGCQRHPIYKCEEVERLAQPADSVCRPNGNLDNMAIDMATRASVL